MFKNSALRVLSKSVSTKATSLPLFITLTSRNNDLFLEKKKK